MIQTLTCRMDLAAEYGVDVAIFLHNIYHWMLKNQANQEHFYDGRYWAHSSYNGLVRWFSPLWSIQQIKRIVSKCKDAELLLIGDYNPDGFTHTNWYSVSDKIMEIYGSNMTPGDVVRNRTIDSSEMSQKWSEIGLSYNEYINNINNPPIVPQGGRRKKDEPKRQPDWKPERFSGLWDYYPHDKRGNKQKAIAAWDKLKPSDDLINDIGRRLKRLMASESWQEGVGIPHVSTFLNQRRWEDADNLDGHTARQERHEEVYGWQM